ncbi:SDR family NAD(P)-dependent oxidoreductase [Metabacillus sp. Hm71]|uniref:SDR family NAD(P)-dependent oxidoreductase n=1 Tax=Metabacillus sp. Hm71 TaxID=3450743 RepID=UPI003F41EAD3
MYHFNLNNKVALVTGVADHLGIEICEILEKAGANVWQHQFNEDHLVEEIFTKLRIDGSKIQTITGDLRTPYTVKSLIGEILDKSGKIDILINLSEIASPRSLHELTPEEWLDTFAVNLDVPFLCCQEIIPLMVENGGGVIVNISSQAAETGGIGPHYASTKSALDALTKGILREYKEKGVRVNTISPSVQLHDESLSEQIKMNIRATIANMILLLSSSSTCLVNGETLFIGKEATIK